MASFEVQKRKKNCNCAKKWTHYTTIKADDYHKALDRVIIMSQGSEAFSFKIKR